MVSTTFKNLPPIKKKHIEHSLLQEFSTHSLAEAQVARIIKSACIARGAFYKYFTDLLDAYRYLLMKAIATIHVGIKPGGSFAPDVFYQQVKNFIDRCEHSEYYALIQMYFAKNESELPLNINDNEQLLAADWAAMVLSHEVIKIILLNPAKKDFYLRRFKASLHLLEKKES